MRKIGAEGTPNESSYQNWPLFKEFRKNRQFEDAYIHVFKRAFVTVEEALKLSSSPGPMLSQLPADAVSDSLKSGNEPAEKTKDAIGDDIETVH